MKKLIVALVFAVGLNGFIGCSEVDEPKFEFDEKTTLDEVMDVLAQIQNDIQGIVLDKSCDGQGGCKVLAYGKKACGGPSAYVVYGSKIDEDHLTEKANEYTLLQDEANRRFGLGSDCSILNVPEVACVDGKCIEI